MCFRYIIHVWPTVKCLIDTYIELGTHILPLMEFEIERDRIQYKSVYKLK